MCKIPVNSGINYPNPTGLNHQRLGPGPTGPHEIFHPKTPRRVDLLPKAHEAGSTFVFRLGWPSGPSLTLPETNVSFVPENAWLEWLEDEICERFLLGWSHLL